MGILDVNIAPIYLMEYSVQALIIIDIILKTTSWGVLELVNLVRDATTRWGAV